MKTTMLKAASALFSAAALMIAAPASMAVSDYLVIQDGTELRVGDRDGSYTNAVIVAFELPANLHTSGTVTRMAVLELAVRNASKSFNEVYINPPTQVCSDDGAGVDLNDAASVHYIDEHDGTGRPNEYFTNLRLFSSALLHPGANILMICARDINGTVNGNLDDLLVSRVFLHYQTD